MKNRKINLYAVYIILDVEDTTSNIVIELIYSIFKSKTNKLQEDFYNFECI